MDGQESRLRTGAVIDGRYELRRALGQGAEGTVYEAIHCFTGQRCAVKVATHPIPIGTESGRVRLLREARALGQLHHPNIVAITDAGVTDGFPFVAMELLEGRSLDSLLTTRGRLAIADAVGAALQVADALVAAHAVGVLHRDVKPANVIIVRSGEKEIIKLVDFGTTKPMGPGAERVTAAGALVGTPAYMAPEQLLAQDVDEGADIYAIGVMLFECLTGVVPYEGAYPKVLMAACTNDPPPSARHVRPQIEVELNAIIDRALAKKRSDRFATMADLVKALRAACPRVDGLTRLLEAPVAEARRKFNRAPYRTPVRVRAAFGEVDGRCEDVSEGGMLLLSTQALKQNDEVSVRFALPIEGRVCVCKARVQWVRTRADRAITQLATGLEFLDLSNEVRASIAQYVALMTGTLNPAPEPKLAPLAPSTHIAKTTLPATPAALVHNANRIAIR